MARLTVDPGVVDAVLRDLWCSLFSLALEFEHQRSGTPDYAPTADHAFDTLTGACETIQGLL